MSFECRQLASPDFVANSLWGTSLNIEVCEVHSRLPLLSLLGIELALNPHHLPSFCFTRGGATCGCHGVCLVFVARHAPGASVGLEWAISKFSWQAQAIKAESCVQIVLSRVIQFAVDSEPDLCIGPPQHLRTLNTGMLVILSEWCTVS